ncbi:MAG TPA: DegT/DnrJ/EryC1/StrS family aminotransferase [Thermomicrobiales bacterium]|nr:DegT/DnrJ/EryC1/StrS family aminotransferase [Thermomicrobiales bacterium]
MTAPFCPSIGHHLFAPRDTLLDPRMLAHRRTAHQPWVLEHPAIAWHYLGRNASFALVKGLGLDAGSEILFPAFFGPPVLQAPMEAGATIRFYQVRQGLEVRIEDIRAAMTPQTKAIYVIHFNGFPAPMAEIMALARERDLLVIEDAAHALLTTIDGQPAGSLGDGAVFSFYKWVPVPNGAALVTNRPPVKPIPPADKRSLTSGAALTAFSMLTWADQNCGRPGAFLNDHIRSLGKRVSRHSSLAYVSTGGVQFHHDELDYAMSAISRRILAVQPWESIINRRRENYTHLSELLRDIAPPAQGSLPTGATPLFYATAVADKRAILTRLAARGIEGRNFWELHHPDLPAGVFPETDMLRQTTMELPIHQDLDHRDIEMIAAALRAVLGTRPATAVLERIAS